MKEKKMQEKIHSGLKIFAALGKRSDRKSESFSIRDFAFSFKDSTKLIQKKIHSGLKIFAALERKNPNENPIENPNLFGFAKKFIPV